MPRYFIKTLLILSVIVSSSCGRSEKNSTSSGRDGLEEGLIQITSAQFKENQFELGKLQDRIFKHHIEVAGMIDVPPQNKAVVSIPVGGYITNTELLVGDHVQKGQVLVTLENPEFIKLQQNYMEIKQQLRYLEAEYERHQKLHEENITSQKNFLKAESDYKTALATFEGLSQQLRILNISTDKLEAGQMSPRTNIYAPISGSISKMNITKGAYVSPATEVMEIINTDHIHLELVVFEKDIIHVQEGQAIEFQIPEASKEVYSGRVYRMGSSIDENRRILVHGHIEKPNSLNLLQGMFVNASIIIDSIQRKALPEAAVVQMGERNFILKLIEKSENEYVFKIVEVDAIDKVSGFVGIGSESLIKDEDEFLTSGAFSLIGNY